MKQNTPQERYAYMTQTPIPKLIGSLAVPTIISMLVSNIYNMADTFFVGSYRRRRRRRSALFFRSWRSSTL